MCWAAVGEDTCTIRVGVEMRVERVMARFVASVSKSCGRDVAWYLGKYSPFFSS